MSTQAQKFVLIGPHEGKSLTINGHEFIGGEYIFRGAADQIATLTRIFDFYGAVPFETARLMELEAQATKPASSPEVLLAKPTEAPAPAPAEEPVEIKKEGTGLGQPDLGMAIGALDPERDEDWTSNNLPSLDRLAELVGKKVSRDDVETLAAGYTRAKARAARA